MTCGSRRIAAKDLLVLLGGEFRDAERAAEVGERHRDVDEDRNDKEDNGQDDRRAEKDHEVRPPAPRRARMAAPFDHQFVRGRGHRPGLCEAAGPPVAPRRSALAARLRMDLFDDHVIERRARLFDDEIGRLLAGQPPALNPLNRGVDDAVEVAELRIVGQELGDLEQLRCPRQRPGLRVTRVLELLGLDAEMGRRDRVVGVEVGVGGEAEQPGGELGVLRVGRDRIDDGMGQAARPNRPSRRRLGDPAPVLGEGTPRRFGSP